MAITKFDEATVKMVRKEIEQALKEACDRIGIKPPGLGNITFNNHSISTAKLVFGILTPPIDKDTAGLMGQEFRQGAGRFTVKEIHPEHVIALSARGKRYRIGYDQLNKMMTDNNFGNRVGKEYNI
jgi:hypothetical protein